MRKSKLCIAAALITVLAAREAAGDTWHLKTPSTVTTQGGSNLTLPPGYFLDEETWRERDLELKELQDQRTRLKAENESLRKSTDEYPWAATGLVGVFGIALGVFLVTNLK